MHILMGSFLQETATCARGYIPKPSGWSRKHCILCGHRANETSTPMGFLWALCFLLQGWRPSISLFAVRLRTAALCTSALLSHEVQAGTAPMAVAFRSLWPVVNVVIRQPALNHDIKLGNICELERLYPKYLHTSVCMRKVRVLGSTKILINYHISQQFQLKKLLTVLKLTLKILSETSQVIFFS